MTKKTEHKLEININIKLMENLIFKSREGNQFQIDIYNRPVYSEELEKLSCELEWRDELLSRRNRNLLWRDRILSSQSIQRFSVGLQRGSKTLGAGLKQKTGEVRMKRLMTTLLDGAISSGLHKEVMSCENTAQLYNKVVEYFPNDFNNASLHSLLAFMAMSLYMDFREGEIVETAWRNYAFRKSDMAWILTQLHNSRYVEELKVKTLDANTHYMPELINELLNNKNPRL